MTGLHQPFVEIVEMSPRDGLQNEAAIVATPDKIRLVDLLSGCGFRRIEVASFVSPRWVPQMADGAGVLAGMKRQTGMQALALVPNLRGYEDARAAKADAVAVFASASEAFSQANINCSIQESLERFRPVLEAARVNSVPVRGYVSCAIACPYSGQVSPLDVASVAAALAKMGCDEISLGDTIGAGTPETMERMLCAVLSELPADRLAGHFHDTNNQALENVEAALECGLRVFDASVGGLGGCPFAPGAKGNVDTLALDRRLRDLGFTTGLNPAALGEAAHFARSLARGAA